MIARTAMHLGNTKEFAAGTVITMPAANIAGLATGTTVMTLDGEKPAEHLNVVIASLHVTAAWPFCAKSAAKKLSLPPFRSKPDPWATPAPKTT